MIKRTELSSTTGQWTKANNNKKRLIKPLEGTSLHRWNNSVERPWGILSLFTTCLRLQVKSPYHRLWHVAYARKNSEKNRAKRNVKKNKTTQNRSWVEEGIKQDWKEADKTNKGTILSTKMNSTTTKTCTEGLRENPRAKQWEEKGATQCASNNRTTEKA